MLRADFDGVTDPQPVTRRQLTISLGDGFNNSAFRVPALLVWRARPRTREEYPGGQHAKIAQIRLKWWLCQSVLHYPNPVLTGKLVA